MRNPIQSQSIERPEKREKVFKSRGPQAFNINTSLLSLIVSCQRHRTKDCFVWHRAAAASQIRIPACRNGTAKHLQMSYTSFLIKYARTVENVYWKCKLWECSQKASVGRKSRRGKSTRFRCAPYALFGVRLLTLLACVVVFFFSFI